MTPLIPASNPATGRHLQPNTASAGSPKSNLAFMRFALAAIVVYCHCYPIIFAKVDSVEPLCVASGGQLSWGTLAVDFFFVISGFLVTQSWQHSRGALDYLRKRVLRIYPAFAVASLACLFVFGPLGLFGSVPLNAHSWLAYVRHCHPRHFLLGIVQLHEPRVPETLRNDPVPNVIDAPIWTIRYEFQCYLLVPALALIGAFRRRAALLVLFAAAYVLQAGQYYRGWELHHWTEIKYLGKPDFWPRFATYFLAGAIVYTFRERIPRLPALAVFSAVILALSVFHGHALALTEPLFGPYLAFYLAYRPFGRLHAFDRYGDFSYGAYLYAWPIQQLLVQRYASARHPAVLLAEALSLATVLAAASWHGIEKPFLKLKRRASGFRLVSPADESDTTMTAPLASAPTPNPSRREGLESSPSRRPGGEPASH